MACVNLEDLYHRLKAAGKRADKRSLKGQEPVVSMKMSAQELHVLRDLVFKEGQKG